MRGKKQQQLFIFHTIHNTGEWIFSIVFVCFAFAVQAQEVSQEESFEELTVFEIFPESSSESVTDEIVPDRIDTLPEGEEVITDQFVVTIDESTSQETVEFLQEVSVDIDPILDNEEEKEQYLTITVEEDQKESIEEILKEREDVVVESHYIRRATAIPNDTYHSTQWYHKNDNAGIYTLAGWNVEKGSSDIVVAVIDSGLDVDHPDIIENRWVNSDEIPDNGIDDDVNGYVDDFYGYDFVKNDPDPHPKPDGKDNDGYAGADTSVDHGTHVAGIIGATGNNGKGVSGVAWDVSLMGLRVLDDEGSGTDADIVESVQYAIDNNADIINLSLGGYGESTMLENALQKAADAGIIIVAAAGNDATNIHYNPFFPACYDGIVLAVSSTDTTGKPSSFSNFGDGKNCVVDIAAPGELIYSTLYANDAEYGFTEEYGFLTGTSMAAPIVSGVIALVIAQDQELDRTTIFSLLQDNTHQNDIARKYGTGIVNAQRAIDAVSSAHYPSIPTDFSILRQSQKKISFGATSRTRVQSPLFSWYGAHDIEGITGYYVYFGPKKSADPEISGVFQEEPTYAASGLRGDSKKWYLRIKTQDSDGHISEETATLSYHIDTVIPKVKQVQVTQQETEMIVQWKKLGKKQNVKKYVIQRSLAGKKQFRTIGKVSKKTNQFIEESPSSGETYLYRLKAIDDLQNVSFSKTVRVTVQ